MGVEDFQKFIRQKCPGAYVHVDLLSVAQGIAVKQRKQPQGTQSHQQLQIIIDGECCLDRLYGGYFNDWVCGGQWNRMLQFLQLLITTMHSNKINVVVFFNGASEIERFAEWSKNEASKMDKVVQIMRHVRRRHTPPPKVLWLPPAGLRCALRLALRHLMVPVYQTVEDHKHEVMSFLRTNNFDALLIEGAEYLFFDPPRYFSAEALKLTFRGTLETEELVLDEVAKQLDLHPNRFSLFAALLGNCIVPQEELLGFYEELFGDGKLDKEEDLHRLIQALLAFVRNLVTIDDLPAIGQFIFRHVNKESERNEKAGRFVRSAQYYMNSSRVHFEKFWKLSPLGAVPPLNQRHFGKFASESKGGELHDVGDGCRVENTKLLHPKELESLQKELAQVEDVLLSQPVNGDNSVDTTGLTTNHYCGNAGNGKNDFSAENREVNQLAKAAICAKNALSKAECSQNSVAEHKVPEIPAEILRVCFDRHQKGAMHSWVHQCLTKAVIKIDCYLEEGPDLPFGWQLWRPVRQRVYAVLFNLNHRLFLSRQESEPVKDKVATVPKTVEAQLKPGKEPGKYPSDLTTRISIKEWICNPKRNAYYQAESVFATPLEWKGVPTIQRLWFGRQPEDKKKRLKTFLQCMGADTSLMLNSSHVPQHLLLLCCVLKYMIDYNENRVLTKNELDAFLAQAVSPQLMDPNSVQELQIKSLTPRGVHLAQIFMQGVEHALFANDACGAPIPWVMCFPWLFFDGKLFQAKLDIAENKRSLIDICCGQADKVAQVERMRNAIFEGRAQLSPRIQTVMISGTKLQNNNTFRPDAAQRYISDNHDRGMIGRRDIFARGGQLEVAGVVVGQWGGQSTAKFKNRNSAPNSSQNVSSPLRCIAPDGRGNRSAYPIPAVPPPLALGRPMPPVPSDFFNGRFFPLPPFPVSAVNRYPRFSLYNNNFGRRNGPVSVPQSAMTMPRNRAFVRYSQPRPVVPHEVSAKFSKDFGRSDGPCFAEISKSSSK